MNKILLTVFAILSLVSLGAHGEEIEDVEMREMSDPEFEWTQFDNKEASCLQKKHGFLLMSKKKGHFAVTTSELPFTISDDAELTMSFSLEPESISDDNPFGIVFDYKNIKNFCVIKFGKKNFQIVSYEGGEAAVVKEGLYKLSDKKSVFVTMELKNKKLNFYMGQQYLHLTTLRNYQFKRSVVGVMAENTAKLNITGFGYRLKQHEDMEIE